MAPGVAGLALRYQLDLVSTVTMQADSDDDTISADVHHSQLPPTGEHPAHP